jgi:competence protein ComEC
MKLPHISFLILFLAFYLFRLSHLPQIKIPQGQTVKIRGIVTKQPYLSGSQQIIQVDNIFLLANRFPGYFYGDRLEVSGKFQKKVIKIFEEQYWAFFPDIRLLKEEASLIGKTDFQKFLLKTRGQAEKRIRNLLPSKEASLLLGVVLGVKSQMPENFWQNLRKTGTLHLIVASGQNVAFLSGFLINFLVIFLNRKKAIVLALFLIIFYVLLVGAEPPVVRAGLMVGLAFTAQLLGKEGEVFRFLLLSALLMLIIQPLLLFDLSFQLSFAATAGLILLYPKLKERWPAWPRFTFLTDGFLISLSAQIMTLPILLVNFGQLSWFSPLINTLVLPLIPILMVLGFILIIISFIITPLAQLLAWLISPLLFYFVKTVDFFGSFSWIAWEMEKINGWWALFYYLLLIFILRKGDVRGKNS